MEFTEYTQKMEPFITKVSTKKSSSKRIDEDFFIVRIVVTTGCRKSKNNYRQRWKPDGRGG